MVEIPGREPGQIYDVLPGTQLLAIAPEKLRKISAETEEVHDVIEIAVCSSPSSYATCALEVPAGWPALPPHA